MGYSNHRINHFAASMPPARRNALAIPLGEDGIPTAISNLCDLCVPCGSNNVPLHYDADGNMTSDERGWHCDWNGQYQFVSVSTNGVFAEGYSYDALGRRVSTTAAEGTVMHVYDDGWQCVADIDEDGNVVASYVWGDGIDNLLAVKIGEATYYALTDVQGTVWGYADSANNVVARWQYDAWGNVLSEVCTVPALATIRYRFHGREWSAATGLVNFRMRWYDPDTGRWLSKDPIGLSGGLNLYAFCGNDSINRVDHCGNISALVGFIGGAAIGGFSGFITGGGLVGTLAGALGGGIGGLVTVLTGNPTLGCAVSGFITSTLSEISKGDEKNWGSVAVNTLCGAGFGFLAEPIGEIDQLLGDIYTGVVPGMVSAICYLPEKFSKSRCD